MPRLAFIGAGLFARQAHLPCVKSLVQNLAPVAVWSRTLRSAQSFAVLAEVPLGVYADDAGDGKGLDDLLTRDDIDCVLVAVPIAETLIYVRKALAAGKHVLSEKPLGHTVPACCEAVTAYNMSHGHAKWVVAENFTFDEAPDFVANVFRSGRLGRLRNFSMHMHGLILTTNQYYLTSWRTQPTHPGGFILDAGAHLFAELRHFFLEADGFGWPPTQVCAFDRQLQEHLPPLDSLVGIVTLPGGALGTLNIGFGDECDINERPHFQAYCSKGTLQIWLGQCTEHQAITHTNWRVVVQPAGCPTEERWFSQGAADSSGEYVEGRVVQRELEAFAKAVETGDWTDCDRRGSPRRALLDVVVIDALLTSATLGHPVRIGNVLA